ncbi:uncharacterized protein LOC134100991 isoform X2 [Sardina pilchardus]|uniref:uncharacterized protein LOC134100991 isoform X2 n=1 Tax=Sardina pilchardus TaxID=27697 RepID=UPI002E0DAEB0
MNEEEEMDELGEKLYDLIFSKHGEIAGKLTGMMLELPDKVIKQMLQDESVLNDGISRALQALSPDSQVVCEVEETSASSDSLGERLYDLIDLHNTGHTHKITGMLLEQNKEAILQILSDPELLEKKINIALKTLLEQEEEGTNMIESSDSEVESESVGEKLFNLVKQIDPTHSADITGMLLEMDSKSLNQVMKDHSMLEVAVKRAQSALQSLTHTHSSE